MVHAEAVNTRHAIQQWHPAWHCTVLPSTTSYMVEIVFKGRVFFLHETTDHSLALMTATFQ